MKKYELMMIIDPMLEKQALETLISDLRSELDVHGLSVESEVVWGVRDMAYKINGSKQGYYLIYTPSQLLVSISQDSIKSLESKRLVEISFDCYSCLIDFWYYENC